MQGQDIIIIRLGGSEGAAGAQAQALRGDDALSRAAAEVAAPRRRLLAGLRDAHAEACAWRDALRACQAGPAGMAPAIAPLLARLAAEAEDQLDRLETMLAQLRERPGAGLLAAAGSPVELAARPGRDQDAALLLALEAGERHGVEEAAMLRRLAEIAGQPRVAALAAITAAEKAAAADAIAALRPRRAPPAGAALRH